MVVLIHVTTIMLCGCAGRGSGVTDGTPVPNNPAITAIYDIQGSSSVSPIVGQSVVVRGIVTGDFQNGDSNSQNDLGGFFLQEENPDTDPMTSDGVFVFDGSSPAVDVNVADRVTVDGVVNEHFGETQINAADVEINASGVRAIPVTEVTLPTTATVANGDGDPIADLESYEGMLVRFSQVLAVASLHGLERYGEVLLSQGGRPIHYTNKNAPGVTAYAADQDQIAARRFILDDGLPIQNAKPVRYLQAPFAVRVGDTVSNLTGNIRYSRGGGSSGIESYRLVPAVEPSFMSVNPRPAAAPDVGGVLTVASFNLDNFFTTIDTGRSVCGPSGNINCRGANSRKEFDRQRTKIISALVQLDADIVALAELENDPNETLQSLVDGLNEAAGAGRYAYVDTGTIGTDAIRVGILYQPASVAMSGVFAVLDSSVDQRFDDSRNRPTVAQSFVQKSNGAVFTVAANHLKSKSSDCSIVGDPDRNDGQSHCNVTRTDAAAAMADWLVSDPTASGDPDVLIIGDLNAYLQEDPVTTLKAAGYENLLEKFLGSDSYSYVFEGKAGSVDHALASQSLVGQVTGIMEWHINADEAAVHDYNLEFGRDAAIFDGSGPYRASDHDPLIVGLDLVN